MADGITCIAVEGFKSIAKRQEIEIAPLTILSGANSSGKSSIMQPLLLLKQTLEAKYDPGYLRIDGDNVRFSSSDQFLSKNGGAEAHKTLTVEIASGERKYSVSFKKKGNLEFELEQRATIRGKILSLRPDMPESEIRSQVTVPETPDKLTVLRAGFLLNVGLTTGTPITSQWIEPPLRKLVHVPGRRGTEFRVYNVAAPGPNFPGTFDYYVASVIHHWQAQDPENHAALNHDLGHLGLVQRIYAHKMNDASIELRVPRVPKSYDMLNIADVGFGVSQVLPVLVALRAADEGRLVYLEEPEIHLHPRAQTKLADVLADAAKRGVRVVAETHSSLLVRAVQTLVAKGDLAPELVRFHWFSRDRDGVTQVNSAKLDANGAFGDWPEDFGDVALESEKEYLDAVEDRLTQ